MADEGAITILCSPDGTVIEVLRDDFGLKPSFRPGTSFASIMTAKSLPQALRFLRLIRQSSSALDYGLEVATPGEVVPLVFLGYGSKRGIVIIGAKEALSRQFLMQELAVVGHHGSHKPRHGLEGRTPLGRDILLADAVHGLRNPLNGILAATQYLLEDAARLLEADHVRMLKSIESSSRLMFGLIDALVEPAATQAGNVSLDLKPTDILALIKKKVWMQRRVAKRKKVWLDLEVAASPPLIPLEAGRFNLAIDKLLSSNIALSSSGGRIEVSVGVKDQRVMISVCARQPDVSLDELGILFDAELDVKQAASKTRLAMALRIAEQIVEEHGGSFRFEGVGKGLMFTMALPTSRQAPAAAAKVRTAR